MANSKSGILAFECSEDNYEPNVMHFWERYDGNRSMGLHNTTDEYSKFMQVVRGLHVVVCTLPKAIIAGVQNQMPSCRSNSTLRDLLAWPCMTGRTAR